MSVNKKGRPPAAHGLELSESYPASREDATILSSASQFDSRWRREAALLGLIAPEPKHRLPLAAEIGVTLDDFTGDDTQWIARALAVGHEHGRRICALLARNLLIDADLWDDDDLRPFIGGSIWGPGPLAVLFIRGMTLEHEYRAIADALVELRRWSVIPPAITTRDLRKGAA